MREISYNHDMQFLRHIFLSKSMEKERKLPLLWIDLLAFINECIDEYYADGTYDTLWTKWIDASGEGEEAAAAEDAETAE